MHFNPSLYNWSEYTILVVEDDYSSTFFLKEVLKDSGISIIYAGDGQEAVDICKSELKIDIILMDIRMPVMGGFEATRAIRLVRPEVPIIAQTANAVYDTRLLCVEAGCNDYISKPIDSVELLQKISEFLKSPGSN